MRESQIIHERGAFWVFHEAPGLFRVFEITGVASYRRGTYHFSNDPARARSMAIADCDRRALACSGSARPCRHCQRPRCERHRFSYVDGNNGAITRNAPELCASCYAKAHHPDRLCLQTS